MMTHMQSKNFNLHFKNYDDLFERQEDLIEWFVNQKCSINFIYYFCNGAAQLAKWIQNL